MENVLACAYRHNWTRNQPVFDPKNTEWNRVSTSEYERITKLFPTTKDELKPTQHNIT